MSPGRFSRPPHQASWNACSQQPTPAMHTSAPLHSMPHRITGVLQHHTLGQHAQVGEGAASAPAAEASQACFKHTCRSSMRTEPCAGEGSPAAAAPAPA